MSGRSDVWWDWNAADEASGALRRMASAIDAAARQRASAASVLLTGWEGPRQREWAARHAAIQAEAIRLREQCLHAANAIAQASARARAEQDRLNRERQAAQQATNYAGQP